MKQEVFPYSVPHLRLPLLPSSRNELVQISNVLAKFEIIPWKLQNIKIKYTKRRESNRTVDAHESRIGEVEEVNDSTQNCDKLMLKIFVPSSGWEK